MPPEVNTNKFFNSTKTWWYVGLLIVGIIFLAFMWKKIKVEHTK